MGLSVFLVRMLRTSSIPACTIVRSVRARASAHPIATLSSASTMSRGKLASASWLGLRVRVRVRVRG